MIIWRFVLGLDFTNYQNPTKTQISFHILKLILLNIFKIKLVDIKRLKMMNKILNKVMKRFIMQNLNLRNPQMIQQILY